MSAPTIASASVRSRRVDGVGRFPLVHALAAAAIDDALGVAQDDVLGSKPIALISSRQAMPAAPAPLQTSRVVLMSRPVSWHGVDQAGRGDDRGAVLVVVEDRDVHQLAQALLDDEALRRLDVLEIDAAEATGRDSLTHVDEFVGVLGGDLEVDRSRRRRSA